MTATTATLFDDASSDQPAHIPRSSTVPPPAGWPAPPGPAAYHGLLGEIVRKLEPETEADPVAILTPRFSGLAEDWVRGAFGRGSA